MAQLRSDWQQIHKEPAQARVTLKRLIVKESVEVV